ncbi:MULTISPECIES: response regulator transcription factor [unclassified Clostridioides]|uniref:response regulator transcription factor n=1 Tax=unclassified Clostridioides TaxID=2635829 RepID=UPI001D1305ED|nr:response regulator transcription factor [Clostridioides sp. ZZV14-6150]MCC0662344.1 response regulator transcription factor [Clostridioides sp. ZZV14-6154]MCC0670251.1 response regulator transcription factor [Clostridioides sp. ZZV14-6153]MCC0720568.1 response regulator transcription factor [Clostridioides sp. ZZV14-6105]MCC0724575.1 response regulator transcription factor [Clostridioides sp. ZZV14-6104]MCC0728678.1 response regulator transcription factor [Clostridioides sp. ZZV14-6045]MCC
MNILIADDEVSMIKILCAYFKKEGFNVFTAKNGEEALNVFYENKIDLAILDWMMPVIDGIGVCKEIKENSNTKVLMLTAKSQSEDEIEALNIGADEYVKKPFDPRVLIIRAKKLVNYKDTINIKDLKIDFESNKVFKGNDELLLTKKELELIHCLVNNKGIVLSRERLLDLVWGLDYDGDFRTVDTHIRRLRTKVGEDIIKTYRGLGYSLEDFDD